MHIGPITLQVWGLCVALGMIAALLVILRIARLRKLKQQLVIDMAFWIILASLIGGRLVYVFSEWAYYQQHLIEIIQIWDGGMGISGGFLGALLAGLVYLRLHHLPIMPYVEACIIGLPLGLGIGRIGCFFIFDHPGVVTDFFLGEQYLDGLVRHNHGLYLSIDGFVLAAVFYLLWKRNPNRAVGFYTTLFLLWDGTTRFLLDFLRATDLPNADPRYFSLTVAQYLSLAMIAAGGVLWYTRTHTSLIDSHAKSHKTKTS